MQSPLSIHFHEMEPSPAVEAEVRKKVEKLQRYYSRITSCRVTITADHRRHNQGNTYLVRLDISLPGSDVVVTRDPGDRNAHTDVYVALRDAFRAAERQLKAAVKVRRRRVKHHEPTPTAQVAQLHATGYGFLRTPDNREIYFHRNSVVGGAFDSLRVGDAVYFAEEQGDKGPQASSVRPT